LLLEKMMIGEDLKWLVELWTITKRREMQIEV
jgi:hypothetical protein